MTWVVSKIIGDGKSTDTAFRTAAQQYGLPILNENAIPIDPKTGQPTSTFGLLRIPDGTEKVLAAEPGAYVVQDKAASVGVSDKTTITASLAAQACVVDLSAAAKGADVLAAIQAKFAAASAVKL